MVTDDAYIAARRRYRTEVLINLAMKQDADGVYAFLKECEEKFAHQEVRRRRGKIASVSVFLAIWLGLSWAAIAHLSPWIKAWLT